MKLATIVLIGTLCVSCSAGRWQELPAPAKAIALRGFTFVPPADPGWHVNTEASPDSSLLVARRGDPYENYAIEAYVLPVPVFESDADFLRAAKDGWGVKHDPRYKLKEEHVDDHVLQGERAVLGHALAQDDGEPPRFGFGNPRQPGPMMFEEITLWCRHPRNRKLCLNLTFSLRFYPGEADASFRERAMRVVESVRFTDP